MVWGLGLCFLVLMEHGLGRAPPYMGHLTCVCFDFVVPAWKLDLPVKTINKMDVTLILQCYYQQGEKNFCPNFLKTLKGLTSVAKDVPSSPC